MTDCTLVNPQRSSRLRGWRTYDSPQSRPPSSASLSLTEIGERIVAQLLRSDIHVIMIGPLVLRAALFIDVPEVYFTLATRDDGGFFTIVAGAETAGDAKKVRKAVVAQLQAYRPAKVLLRFDDELALAKACAELWPGAETAAILAQVASERRPG
jgi:hypothetical protein